MPTDNNFAQFIENLRLSRNISREDFVNDIISLRQYQRFLNGESSIKTSNLIQLLEKLEVNSISALIDIMNMYDNGQETLYEAYDKYIKHYFKEALEILSKIEYSKLNTLTSQKLFRFLEISSKIELKLIPESTGIEKMKKLVDYPNILKKDMFSFVEINILLHVSSYLIKNDDDHRIPKLMFNILKKEMFGYNTRLKTYLPIYHTQVARYLGSTGEIEKCLEITNKGIAFCQKYKILNGLQHLLYFKALSEKKLFDDDRYIETTRRLFNTITLFDETELSKKFYRVIEKNLGLTKNDIYK